MIRITLATVTTATVPQETTELRATRQALYAVCKKAGIRHIDVAVEAECSRTYVVQFFGGTRSPRAIALAVEKLLGIAKARKLDQWRREHAAALAEMGG